MTRRILLSAMSASLPRRSPAAALLAVALLPGDFVRTLSFVPCGDWNSDGVGDIAIGLPRDDAHGLDAGRVFVLSGRDGSVVRELHTGVARSGFGFALATGTDVDRDGKADLVVASHGDGFPLALIRGERNRPGRVHVYSPTTGDLIAEFGQPADLNIGLEFASDIDVVGDLDGDGAGDVLVTSRLEADLDPGFTSPLVILAANTGKVLRSYPFGPNTRPLGVADVDGDGVPDVLFGKSCEILWTSPAPGGKPEFKSIATAGLVPRRMAEVGDLDGDGRHDIGVIGHGFGDGRCTDVAVVSTREGRPLFAVEGELVRRHAGVEAYTGASELDACGAPDIDGDGRGELFVVLPGAYRSLTIAEWARIRPDEPRPLGASMSGYAALISSRDGKDIWTTTGSWDEPLGWLVMDYLIEQVRRVPDLDGDGLDDLAVSAAGASTSEPYEEHGAALVVLSSRTGARIAAFDCQAGRTPSARFRPRSSPESRPK